MAFSTSGPFALVLLWTAFKDLWEDSRRRKDDNIENNRPCRRYNFAKKIFEPATWQEVHVGDVLGVFIDEAVPADILLLRSCKGQAFISTVNLDGETNLKERGVVELILEAVVSQDADETTKTLAESAEAATLRVWEVLAENGFVATLAEPCARLEEFDGEVRLRSTKPDATDGGTGGPEDGKEHTQGLSPDNFIPRGCVLRNTGWVIGLAAYTGRETKTSLNIVNSPAKLSSLQTYLNNAVAGLVVLLAVFCLYAAIMSEVLKSNNDYNFAIRFLRFWIILYQIVPISLYVCFEILKLSLGLRINLDPQMYDERSQKFALARTADLVEEMGQVNIVFSDKTGTLTENEMVFARCCVGGLDVGDFRPSNGKLGAGMAKVKQFLAESPDGSEAMSWFFFCLATCNAVQAERSTDGDMVYTSSSPDEVAFVDACKGVGVTLLSRKRMQGAAGWEVLVSGPVDNVVNTFIVYVEIPFSSERKRQSIVCEYKGEIYCITKGADNVMGPLCDAPFGEAYLQSLSTYSKLGLRTLVIASKKLQRTHFETWRMKHRAAAGAPAAVREERLANVAAEMEHSLGLVGISAIEDRLQVGVPEAIETIKAAGIRFWVLTGDKVETAVEIAKSCNLFNSEMVVAYATGPSSFEEALKMLEAARDKLASSGSTGGGLVLDGILVKYVQESERTPRLLYELAMASAACVCCRLSPQQKRCLVDIVKAQNRRGVTLSIGDGANDVSMIQGAHVGIGIRGKEGNQAVQVSDIAISQFRFLVPLLLCHGRRAYRRVSIFLCYYIYKHITLACGDMVWAHQYRFMGTIAYPEWLSSANSVFFTSLPILVTLAFDMDVSDEVSNASPELYVEGLKRMHFNPPIFIAWVISGIWHGCIVWLVPNLTVGSNNPQEFDFWAGSVCSFTLFVLFVDLRLWMIALNPLSKYVLSMIALSLLAYIVTICLLGETNMGVVMDSRFVGVPSVLVSNGKYWLVVCLTPFLLLIDLAIINIFRYLMPTPLAKARSRKMIVANFRDKSAESGET